MIRHLTTLAAVLTLCAATVPATGAGRKPKKAPQPEHSAEADSLRAQNLRLLQRMDSLETVLFAASAAEAHDSATIQDEPIDPEQSAADSIARLQERLKPRRIASTSFDTHDLAILDTLESGNDAVQVVLFSNNTWKYVINREVSRDNTIFEKYWDTKGLFPYREVEMSSMPSSVVIDLLDSVTG
ncbi:MAG: hypothetical protein K2N93_03665 [Alistipes sp.]|nr:hypothetical protein [Alistipes sp.]